MEQEKCDKVSFESIVRGALRSSHSREWSLLSVAIALQISPRTLQRRLAEESLTYKRVTQEELLERAKQLRECGHTLETAATELGFSSGSSLCRFFRNCKKGTLGRAAENQPAQE